MISARLPHLQRPATRQPIACCRSRRCLSTSQCRTATRPVLWGSSEPYKPHQPITVGSANLAWSDLGFDYVPTNGHVRHSWKAGRWDDGTFVREPYMNVHILANVFHYGQALFEGFKVFHRKNGDVCLFNHQANYNRMKHGSARMQMQCPSYSTWTKAAEEVIRQNVEFLPPYGSGGSLYMRPFLFGSGPKLGLGPSTEYTFAVFCNPVGSYYRTGQSPAMDCLVQDEYDRAAPLGSGDCKAAGNYAADLESMLVAKKQGYAISLYLDARERRYVEEFNTSNFVAITKDGKYVTPHAPRSVLASTTNVCLQAMAKDMGMPVEVRPIDFEAEVDTFAEVGAVGTAVVVTPIKSFVRGEKKWEIGGGDVLQELCGRVRAIQQGEAEDKHGWMQKVAIVDDQTKRLLSVYPPL